MATALPQIVAFRLMLTAAQTALSTSYAVVESNSNYTPSQVPGYIIDLLNEVEFTRGPINGSFMVTFVNDYDQSDTLDENIQTISEIVYNTVKALRDLPRLEGYLIDETYTISDKVEHDGEEFDTTNTRFIFGYFIVKFGLQESA